MTHHLRVGSLKEEVNVQGFPRGSLTQTSVNLWAEPCTGSSDGQDQLLQGDFTFLGGPQVPTGCPI